MQYIKQSIPGLIFTPEEPLTAENCDILGSTIDDFYDGKFLPLTEAQANFAMSHPGASAKEILDMAMKPKPEHVATVDEAREEAFMNIDAYANSDAVNAFYANGKPFWLDSQSRMKIANRITAERLAGRKSTAIWLGTERFDMGCDDACLLMRTLELYAAVCYDNIQRHKAAVERMEKAEAIERYDYTEGYPEKLSFSL